MRSWKASNCLRLMGSLLSPVPFSNWISALLLCVIIMKFFFLIPFFLIYTDYVIGSNEANYVTASFLTKAYFKDLGA